jgi:hypothetical protein
MIIWFDINRLQPISVIVLYLKKPERARNLRSPLWKPRARYVRGFQDRLGGLKITGVVRAGNHYSVQDIQEKNRAAAKQDGELINTSQTCGPPFY